MLMLFSGFSSWVLDGFGVEGVSGAGFQVVKVAERSLLNANYQWVSA